MFQTEIHHFLQSYSNVPLNYFMQFITALGYQEFFMLLIAFLIFGLHFKKGFILIQILLWTAAITFFFKYYFALPRPFHVDASLQLLESYNHGHGEVTFFKQGANGFWALLPSEVVTYYRNLGEFSYGFPSGHTSVALTVWGGLALLFRKKWLHYLATALIVLIPFSRIYLGVHFIADVVGGYVLGGILLWFFYQLILQPSKLQAFLAKSHYSFDLKMALFIFSPLLLIPILPKAATVIPAVMLGFNMTFGYFAAKGFPVNAQKWQSVIGGTFLFLIVFTAFIAAFKFLGTSLNIDVGSDAGENSLAHFLQYLISISLSMWLAVMVAYRLNWMSKSEVLVAENK